MSVRRNTENRQLLIRTCHICGRTFPTTAASPFMRMMPNDEGKYHKVAYFCSESCKKSSYKHNMDGLARQRKRERDRRRSKEKRADAWQRYYAANGDKVRAHRRARYQETKDSGLTETQYYRRKRKLLEEEKRA